MSEKYEVMTGKNSDDSGPAQSLYARLESTRQPFLDRARECANYTIPSVLPPLGHNAAEKLYDPWQSIGARGVNNIVSKLMLSLFPPNAPFFRYSLPDKTLDEVTPQQSEAGLKDNVESALGKMERVLLKLMESEGDRVQLHEATKYSVVTGDALIYQHPTDGLKVYRLDRFVCRRDPMGNPVDFITKETTYYDSLPEDVKKKLKEAGKDCSDEDNEEETQDHKNCDIYTHAYRKGKKWTVYQEIKGVKINEGTFTQDNFPYISVPYNLLSGEDYGRSMVEDYIGDLKSLESLSRSGVEGAAAAAKIIWLVNPTGTTQVKTLQDAPNGAIRQGRAEDVTCIQANKAADLQVVQSMVSAIEDRLSYAFLLNSAIQRNAERVTAEEIRYMATELDNTQNGIFSLWGKILQRPYVKLKEYQASKKKLLPKLPEGAVDITIVTGVEALGRGNDANRLTQYLQVCTSTLGPEIVQSELNVSTAMLRLANGLGVDDTDLLKTPEQKAQEQQQQQMMMMAQNFGPEVLKQAGGMAQKGMELNGKQQTQQQQQG